MTRELRLSIRPNGDGRVQVVLDGDGLALAGQTFDRASPKIDAVSVDAFRGGEPAPADVEQLSEDISEWLLDKDLRPLVNQWFQATGDSLRFVVAVDTSLHHAFGDLPLELTRTDAAAAPLVVHPRVDGFVHLLPRVGAKAPDAGPLPWPMRVLMVRSNPDDCGGLVPVAASIRQEILKAGTKAFGNGAVEVDLLSSEPGALGRPVWSVLQETVKTGYDVLVYLGHGDVQQLHPKLPAVSHLQLESEDGPAVHEPVTSKQLANLLYQYPIPVVILAGCLTAAAPGAPALERLPTWMRGNQGMAQALVNSESGVLYAVGMRCRIEAARAKLFLRAFFDSLFDNGTRGNVERAVRAARQKLYLAQPYPPSWAAPMAFTSLVPEPIFGYLNAPPTIEMTPEIRREIDVRRAYLWPLLASQGRTAALDNAVSQNREALRAEILKQGGLLLPELACAAPGSANALEITLEALDFSLLQVTLSTGTSVRLTGLRASPRLGAAGYQFLTDPAQPGFFQIQRRPGAAPARIEGVVVEVDLEVAADAPAGVYPVVSEVVKTDAAGRLWPGEGAVIVTA